MMMQALTNKRVLITGSCGTIGAELLRHLLALGENGPFEVIGVDNDESALFYQDQQYHENDRVSFYLTDVRDLDQLGREMEGVDVVFHTAALKHVIMCERSPVEAVQSNIIAVQNVVVAARQANVERVIFTSSDKAVNPTNVMGTSKLMGERLITAANSNRRGQGPIYSTVRFGNVLGSRGSVVPIFTEQISRGGPLTLTDPGMTRFVLSVEDTAQLLVEACQLAKGGEVFITKMDALRIEDLAGVMIENLAPVYGYLPAEVGVRVVGVKPGEKMYEELMSVDETRRAMELDRFFVLTPAFRRLYHDIEYEYPRFMSGEVRDAYNSSRVPMLSPEGVRDFLERCGLLSRHAGTRGHRELN